jgi:hypothetical protein
VKIVPTAADQALQSHLGCTQGTTQSHLMSVRCASVTYSGVRTGESKGSGRPAGGSSTPSTDNLFPQNRIPRGSSNVERRRRVIAGAGEAPVQGRHPKAVECVPCWASWPGRLRLVRFGLPDRRGASQAA